MNKPAPPIFEPTIIRKTIFGPRPSLRTRQVCLSMKDWKDFAGALQDACPAAWYLRELTQEEKRSENKPDWRPTDHLCGHMERPDKLPFEIDMILDPDWRMDIIRLGPDSYSKWRAPSYGFPFVRIRPGGEVREPYRNYPERIAGGEIWIYCEMDNRSHYAFAQRFFRLFSRFATNTNQVTMIPPEYEIGCSIDKGSMAWLGHDAIRWVRNNPKRLLNCQEGGWGYRPNDDGIVKPPEDA